MSDDKTAEDRVGCLSDEDVRRVLIAVVNSVDHYGAPYQVMKELDRWSLLEASDTLAAIEAATGAKNDGPH